MTWFFLAIYAAAALAAVNHIDKHLIDEYFDGRATGTLIIFSTLAGLPLLPLMYWLDPTLFSVDMMTALLLIVSGLLTVGGYWSYLYALEAGDVSVVGPMWLLTPVFTFFLGFLFLGETLGTIALIGAGLVLVGGFILAIEIEFDAQEEGEEDASAIDTTIAGFNINWTVIGYMLVSTFILAAGSILFKSAALELSWAAGLFWMFMAFAIASVLFLLTPSYRREFFDSIKNNGKGVLAWSALNEGLNVSGELALLSALLMTTAANAALFSDGAQPFFILIFAIILTWLGLESEKVYRHHLIHKLIAIAIMVGGTYLVLMH